MSVPPPPPASVPPPPTPTAATSTGNVAEAKSGGMRLDMASLFGGGDESKKKKALPPWERRGKSAPGDDTRRTPPAKSGGRPKAIPVPATAAITRPPPPSATQTAGANAATSKSPSPAPSAPLRGGGAAEAGRGHSPLSGMPPLGSSSPSPAAAAPLAALPANTSLPNSVPPAQQLAGALEPPPQTALPGPLAPPPPPPPPPQPAPPMPMPTGGSAGAIAAAAPPAPVPLPGTSAAASAQPPPSGPTASDAQGPGTSPPAGGGSAPAPSVNATADMRPSVAYLQMPPTLHTVVKPLHLYYQNEEQVQVVPPIARKHLDSAATAADGANASAEKTTHATPVAVKSRTYWRNSYDLQPSPSTRYTATSAVGVCVATSSTTALRSRLGYASASAARQSEVVSARSTHRESRPARSADAWRKPYFEHLDVHRYVARRYFGTPPPVE